MISLRNITLRRGQTILLQDVNWTIYHKQRIGIIGANGSGKSSLFALLLQTLHADKGELEIPRQIRIAHVAQETPALSMSALDFVLDGDIEWRELQAALKEAEAKNDGTRIALLHEKLSIIDGYTAPSRAAIILDGLGFNPEEQQKAVSDFSGGWRVRLNLAKALMARSDVLLLDEPTNHLDLDAVIWLEQWLLKYAGTLLLISHDRDFWIRRLITLLIFHTSSLNCIPAIILPSKSCVPMNCSCSKRHMKSSKKQSRICNLLWIDFATKLPKRARPRAD